MTIRHTLGILLGFQIEIDTLRKRVAELSWDEPFGMWTREAFLGFCRVMPRDVRTVTFIDLDNIHALNLQLGYEEVDRRIKAAFSIPLRRSDLVARWYSGDEIVILFDSDRAGAEQKLLELRASAARQGLTFTFELGEWEVSRRSVETVIGDLSQRNSRKKARQPRAEANSRALAQQVKEEIAHV